VHVQRTGQKAQFWEIVVGSAVYLITGAVMWAGARTFDAMLVAISRSSSWPVGPQAVRRAEQGCKR
jgi:cytochrome b subunit of formate dehydrogenase